MRGKSALAALAIAALPAADRDPLAGYVAGEPQSCVNQIVTRRGAEIVDAQTILYRDGPRIWVTGPVGECPDLRPLSTLIIRQAGAQVCRNDSFQVRDPGDIVPSGPCRFREFVPYRRAEKK